mgnify:CR=1 FL=1
MRYLSNAFSLSMITMPTAILRVERISREVFCKEAEGAASAIGHEGTAAIISELCGFPVQVNRVAITLQPDDTLYVFQLLTRLPEGKVLSKEEVQQLVAQGKVAFYKVEVTQAS